MKYTNVFAYHWGWITLFSLTFFTGVSGGYFDLAALSAVSLFLLSRFAYDGYMSYVEKIIKPRSWVIPVILLFIVVIGGHDQKMTDERLARDAIEARQDSIRREVEKSKAVEREREQAREEYANRHEKYFSAWDGSCRPLVKVVKASMNDPRSFEHVETIKGQEYNGKVSVKMKFRGKNRFGGTVLQVVTCELSGDGEVSKVEIEQ